MLPVLVWVVSPVVECWPPRNVFGPEPFSWTLTLLPDRMLKFCGVPGPVGLKRLAFGKANGLRLGRAAQDVALSVLFWVVFASARTLAAGKGVGPEETWLEDQVIA